MAKGHYLNNRKLYECIVDYRARVRKAEAEGRPSPPMPDYAGECILMLCNRMGTRFNFAGYSYRDEMVGDAIIDCVNAFYNFDSDRFDNPFGYFSRVGWRAMVRKIFTEKRETYVKFKSLQNSALLGEEFDAPEGWTNPNAIKTQSSRDVVDYRAVTNKIVDEFETLIDKKKKQREKPVEEVEEKEEAA